MEVLVFLLFFDKLGTVEFTPIHFIHQSVKFEELVSLYAIADACVVSSTRDGMNLVSYEYIASQQENHGVLILSEFAGAAQSLNGSLIINPWNTEELSNAIYEAVTMPKETKVSNHQKLFRYVTKYTAAFWGLSFVKELQKVTDEVVLRKVPKLPVNLIQTNFKKSTKKKIFLLDYDGTLTSLHKLPEFAKPSPLLISTLKKLCSIPNVYVYILSGRPRDYLDGWFKDLDVGLVAEHGCFYKHPPKYLEYLDSQAAMNAVNLQRVSSSSSMASLGDNTFHKRLASNNWYALVDQVDSTWRSTIMPLFQHYTERTPGSLIEEKEINLTWHYRNADPEFGIWQATELQVNLEKILSHLPVSVLLHLTSRSFWDQRL